MFKQVFRSYIISFHPKKKKGRGSRQYSFYNIMFFWFLISIIGNDQMWNISYGMIPVFMMYWSDTDTRRYIEKPMFLCPMKYEERKEYINKVLLMKIGVPVLIEIILELLWSYWLGFHIWRMLITLFCCLSAGIAFYIHMDGIDKVDGKIRSAKKSKDGALKVAWMNYVTQISAVVLIQSINILEVAGTDSEFYIYFFGIGVVLLLIGDVIILCTQYRDMVEQSVDYELTFQIPGNLKYISEE